MNARTLTRLIARLRPEWPRLAIIFPLIAVSIAFAVIAPLLLGDAINVLFTGIVNRSLPNGVPKAQIFAELRASGAGHLADMLASMNIAPGTGVDVTRLGQLLGLTSLVYVLSSVASWAQTYLMASVAQRTLLRLRADAEGKLGKLPLSYFDRRPHGEILSLFVNDIDNLTNALESGLIELLRSAAMVIVTVAVMFWISPLLAALALVSIPLSIVSTKPVIRRIRRHAQTQWNLTGDLNGLVEETHTGHELVMAYNQRQPMIAEFDRRNGQLRNASFRTGFLAELVSPVMTVTGNVSYVLLMVVGGFQVAVGVISLGSVQTLLMYVKRNLANSTQAIAGGISTLQSGLVSAQRVFDFLDIPDDLIDGAEGLPDPAGAVAAMPQTSRRLQLEHVSFRYQPDRPLIEDFSLDAAPGQMVAIVGPTGAGKTTLVNLLLRFYEIDGGRILLDGTDYRDLSRDEVRRQFGMVLQDTWLFSGTIWDNIAYGRQDASDEEILAASRAAYADGFIRTLPAGYATVLDSEASSISVGQRQLLTVARAFLADPDILILDEATSNVDTRTEKLIQDATARLRAGRTSFVIAHRMSTIRDADTIIVMNAGRIAEQGSHAELMRLQGLYHELYGSGQYAEMLAP